MTDNDSEPDAAQEHTKEKPGGRSVGIGAFIVVAIIVLSMSLYLLSDRFAPYTQQARVQGFVVGVAPKVAGLVTKVLVTNNELVEQGQVLIEIDRSNYEIALQRARSDLESARSQVDAGSAGVDSARANLRIARANEVKARQDADRQTRLYKEDPGAISVRRLEIAQASLTEARARVSAAEAEIQRAIEQRGRDDEDNSKLQAAMSAVDKATLDLDNTLVRAPSSGVISDLRADVGQFAGTGNPVVTLIAIHDVWIAAEFTENNLAHIAVGSPVEIVFDVLPARVFPGRVRSIGVGVSVGQAPAAGTLPTIQNNRDWLRQAQRFPVIIEFDAIQHETLRDHLRIGGQAEVIAYSEGHPVIRRLAEVFIRLMSWLSYAY
jgi:multidrug resistance efflux pump